MIGFFCPPGRVTAPQCGCVETSHSSCGGVRARGGRTDGLRLPMILCAYCALVLALALHLLYTCFTPGWHLFTPYLPLHFPPPTLASGCLAPVLHLSCVRTGCRAAFDPTAAMPRNLRCDAMRYTERTSLSTGPVLLSVPSGLNERRPGCPLSTPHSPWHLDLSLNLCTQAAANNQQQSGGVVSSPGRERALQFYALDSSPGGAQCGAPVLVSPVRVILS